MNDIKRRYYEWYDRGVIFRSQINRLLFWILLISLGLVIYQISFPKESVIHDRVNDLLRQIPRVLIPIYLYKWILPFLAPAKHGHPLAKDASDLVFALGLFAFHVLKHSHWLLESEWFLYIVLALVASFKLMRESELLKSTVLNPSLLLAGSFILLILIGTAILLIPGASYGNLSFIDALFLSTSAVCITGLASVDPGVALTPLGHASLLVLIQLGGLGLMTFTNFFSYLFKGGMSFHNHMVMSNLIETNTPSSLASILLKIFVYTGLIELLGALLIWWCTDWPGDADFLTSLFHSISAFCNAGFSTLEGGLYHPQVRFSYSLQLIISFLIILGGIGFPVVIDMYDSLKRIFVANIWRDWGKKRGFISPARYLTVHSRLVLTSTFVLLLLGMLVFFVAERNNVLKEHTTWTGKWVASFFGSVTPRTAGFASFDVGSLMQGTVLAYLLLMWIGASPSSTGGGVKTTTFAIAFSNVIALARGKDRVELFRREISSESIRRAFAVIFLSLIIIGLAIFLISLLEPHQSLTRIAFECFSAYSTVGLSMNLTPELGTGSKYVLIVTMIIGRIGLFTFLVGVLQKSPAHAYRYPKENVLII